MCPEKFHENNNSKDRWVDDLLTYLSILRDGQNDNVEG